jgi:hypothetical protein
MDEARVGQKGRTTHLWYEKGLRPLRAHDVGFASAWLFGAVCPGRDEGVALPEVSIAAMDLFLAELAYRSARTPCSSSIRPAGIPAADSTCPST